MIFPGNLCFVRILFVMAFVSHLVHEIMLPSSQASVTSPKSFSDLRFYPLFAISTALHLASIQFPCYTWFPAKTLWYIILILLFIFYKLRRHVTLFKGLSLQVIVL